MERSQKFNIPKEKGNNNNETFSLVARLEASRMLLVYTAHKNDKPFEMDV